MKSLFPFC